MAYRTSPLRQTAYPTASNGPTPHPRHLQGSYRSERFTVSGTLAPYNTSTSPSIPPTRSESFPPRQHMRLNFIHGDRRRHSGPRPFRSRELHLHPPRKPKAPPKSRRLQGASDEASSSTRPDHDPRPGDRPPERYVGPSTGKGARSPPPLGLASALVFALARTYAALSRLPSAKGSSHHYPTRQRVRMTEENQIDIFEEVNPSVPAHSQPSPTHAPPPPTPAGILPASSGAPTIHFPPPTSLGASLPRVSPTSSTSDDHARIAALEGTVNQLVANMSTNMAELFALLRGPNRASSSSTPPSGQGPTVNPASWIPPTQVPESINAPALPTTHTPTVHPLTIPFPPPPAPTAVPLPPAAFQTSDQVLSTPPPVSMPASAPVYTVPSPMVFPASSVPAPAHFQVTEPPPYPSQQPHTSLPYQAPPPINTTFLEPGTTTHAVQYASPTHFLPEVDAEQERRLKRMEETIRTLQANETRPNASYGDCSLFSGMRLPSKVKIPEFRTYEGTTDPRHHLRHYQGKMLQYWDYEEFVIHSFQDSLTGSTFDWFMSLKAKDIPTWEDLSRKFIDQYQYCAETPPTLLDLSMKEMAQGQRFEEYATKWASPQSAKMKGPTSKGEESSKKAPATHDHPAHPTPQQYSVNLTTAPIAAPAYFPPPPQHQPQSIYYSAPPVPPPMTSQPFVHHYAPTPTPSSQPRSPVSRALPPAQHGPASQGPQVNPLLDHRPSSGSSINMISVCTLGEDANAQDNPLPFVIDYTPEEPTVGFAGHMASPASFVVDIPARESYLDNKVPWTYEGGIGDIERQFSVMGVTRSGRVYENPRVTEEEAEAFMKIIKASEYKVVEQMAKSPAHISLLALLLSSEPHREALLRVLTAAQVPKETPLDRMEETVGSIFSNTISFSDDELPSEGWTHSRALHIICKCNNYIIGWVMIDNGSALNVCLVTTLKQMNVDLNRVRPSKIVVRAFDGSWREVNGEIDLLIDVGPCSFSITFQKLITVKGEEDYAIYKETVVPYISVGDDENLLFHSFETIFVIRDYGEIGPVQTRMWTLIGACIARFWIAHTRDLTLSVKFSKQRRM
ncbi:hypothetical protein CRG98_016217 [Punica granatum]|uniref:Retrotransposon gag domain-containing protein n=1 Tax=Punica granatum TaxID=22663 RepID=A0A2I0K4B0_PUNGR|nr:hypothetical protein CRG98_016217 [Punica granatum]